ncbi:hypothetical protein AYO22_01306 [Fonsecaea multimorphosa]|nr:hypothetical protein AYO22_01306 [Fonsecaea multimorphosa]
MPEPENVLLPLRLPSSVRRNPFQSSSRSTQPPPSASSSSFAAGTPRFQRPNPAAVKDDIQTNFDDEEIESTTLSSKTGLISGGKGGGILDELDDDDEIDHQTLSPLYSRGGAQAAAGGVYERDNTKNDIRSPLQHRLRKSAPEQVAKRRKVSHHPASSSVNEPIATPFSPEDDDLDGAHSQIDAGSSPASQSDLDDNLGRPTAPATVTESNRIARFRPITQGYNPPSPPVPRTVFKQPVPEEDHAHAHASVVGSGPVLPDIFSPSRRKGKRDYIPGGSASLVRSWVLDIATQESHTESLSEEMLQIETVERDVSGRFVVVTDEKGHRWLLPEQHERPPGRRSSGSLDCWSELRPGSQVLIKGKATRWSLDLESQGLGSVEVAAYWEPVSPG